MMLYKIWLGKEKQMATCSDYMITCDGKVYEHEDVWMPVFDAHVLRCTDYVYDEPNKMLYELDIVRINHHGDFRDLGIIFHDESAFRVFFPFDSDAEEMLFDIPVEFVTNYYYALNDPKWGDFIISIPDSIRPDRRVKCQ